MIFLNFRWFACSVWQTHWSIIVFTMTCRIKNKVYIKLLCLLALFTVSQAAPQVTVFEQCKSIIWQAFKVKRQATNSVDTGKSKKIQCGDLFWYFGILVALLISRSHIKW